MVTEDLVDLNVTISPSSRKIPALLTKNSAQPCQTESYGGIMWIQGRPTDDDDIYIYIFISLYISINIYIYIYTFLYI